MEQVCLSCKKTLPFLPTVKNRKYCSEPFCQRSRKAAWQRAKMGNDAHYRQNQRQAQRTWQASNPDYWRRYRSANASYRSRERQRQYRRRHPQGSLPQPSQAAEGTTHQSSLQADVAKMDASTQIKPGIYKMQVVSGVAKMDAILVQLIVIEEDRRPQREDLWMSSS
jgi:hypothetical protein